jgi:hypothetical protein
MEIREDKTRHIHIEHDKSGDLKIQVKAKPDNSIANTTSLGIKNNSRQNMTIQ